MLSESHSNPRHPKSTKPPKPKPKLKPKMLAKLEGTVNLRGTSLPLKHIIRQPQVTVGRSDLNTVNNNPFKPAKEGVNLGLGLSSKLSRAHARIQLDPPTNQFFIECLGKNGLTVQLEPEPPVRITPDSNPYLLPSDSVIKLADCILRFTRADSRSSNPSLSKKRKRRDWIKAEHLALRTHMMRLGYGRWDDIIAATSGRLSERNPSELIPVARKFVAHCFVHARPGVEQKALLEILREEPLAQQMDPQTVTEDVDALISAARAESDPLEKRKFVRWARKLRLLSRLRDVHDHPSLDRLRRGDLRVFTPPPALYWTSEDDADLILGSYKHGYGAAEAIRTDEELGFCNRYSRAIPTKKPSTPSKVEKNGEAVHGSEEDEDDDEDEDEDERMGNAHDDADEENGVDHNPRKRLKLGDRANRKEDSTRGEDSVDAGMDDSDLSPLDHKVDDDSIGKNSNKQLPDELEPPKPKKKIVRVVPKRGPRIGNEDGFNDPEDAKAAAESMADENGLVPFPSSESLMRRLKSIINSCAKEYDRDQRELRKKELAASRAKQRKDDLAARKAEKEAEKNKQRQERRIAKSQPFSKKEAVEFEKALSNFGVDYKPDGKTVDWEWFHSKVEGFSAKYDETLDAAYLELLSEAHRISDLAAAKEDEDYDRVEKIEEAKKASTVFSTLTLERAERLIERLQFFRVLRGEVLTHRKITSILRGFKKTRDLPLWWKSSHDRSLLFGVDRYGLNGWEYMGVDSDLSFATSMKLWQRKNGNDLKALKRAAMPKASSGIKRAFALVRYFRSRANDPHFEHYTKDDEAGPSRPAQENIPVKEEKEKAVKMEVVEEKPKVEPLRLGEEKVKRRADSVNPAPSSGRPRTLRETICYIPTDEYGELALPADLGDGLYLISLGELHRMPEFCRNGIVFPVGFRTVRVIGPKAFLCEIWATDDANHPVPLFRVCALEGFDPEGLNGDRMWTGEREIGQSRNIVSLWLKVVNQELSRRADLRDKAALASGPERFGLYESTIVYYLQRLPGAKLIKGFEFRDFSRRGEGRKIEPTIGILKGMFKGIESKLERPEVVQGMDSVPLDDDGRPQLRLTLAEEREMSIPQEWIDRLGGSKKKHRRKSSTYWG